MNGVVGDFTKFLLWERSSRDSLEVKRVYVDMAGDLVAGIVLSQIVYWHLPARDGGSRLQVRKDGHFWLAKGRTDWWAECRVSPKQADRALALLEGRGVIEVRLFRFNGSPTKHVRLVPDGFLRAWDEQLSSDLGVQSPGPGPDPFSPEGRNPNPPTRKVQFAGPATSLTETPTETFTAPCGPGADAAHEIEERLVGHGVGRKVARRLARTKPDACRRYLEYLPYAKLRTTAGAWLANAIRDEYGPPERYVKARQRSGTTPDRRPQRPSRPPAPALPLGVVVRREYRRLLRQGGDRLAEFTRYTQHQRARLDRIVTHLSPARRDERLTAFDRPAGRLALFARWTAAAVGSLPGSSSFQETSADDVQSPGPVLLPRSAANGA